MGNAGMAGAGAGVGAPAPNRKAAFYLCVLGAGVCWGTTGFFNRYLTSFGFSQEQFLLIRCVVALAAVTVLALVTDRGAFRIKLRDLWVFLGSGLLSLTMFGLAYMHAMQEMPLSMAVVLLYTSPVFVVLFSAVLFKEYITLRKVAALLLVIVGAACTVGLFSSGAVVSPFGLALGLVAGLGYALYSIFTRIAFNKGYSGNTVQFYTFLFSSIAVCLVTDADALPGLIANAQALKVGGWIWVWMLAVGVITCFVPYLLYTKGLERVENGQASVLATVEVVVSTLVSVLVFSEPFGLENALGIVLVIAGIAVMNLKFRK